MFSTGSTRRPTLAEMARSDPAEYGAGGTIADYSDLSLLPSNHLEIVLTVDTNGALPGTPGLGTGAYSLVLKAPTPPALGQTNGTPGLQDAGRAALNQTGFVPNGANTTLDFTLVVPSASGGTSGVDFLVNNDANGTQSTSSTASNPATEQFSSRTVAIDHSGNYAVVWISQGQDGDRNPTLPDGSANPNYDPNAATAAGVYMRMYNRDGTPMMQTTLTQNTSASASTITVDPVTAARFPQTTTTLATSVTSAATTIQVDPATAVQFPATTTSLTTRISSSITTLYVDALTAAQFPRSGPFTIVVDGEHMSVVNGFGTAKWTVVRAVDNTHVASHQANATVTLAGPYAIVVDGEHMLVTAGMGTTTWTVLRGQDGTAVTTHAPGATVTVNNPFMIAVDNEHLWVTNVTTIGGMTTWTVTRGMDGTKAAAHSTGAKAIGLVDIQVNTTTKGDQTSPCIAMDADGDFVVTWASEGQDADGSWGIYAQRFNSLGQKVGPEIHVNADYTGDQAAPAVAMNPYGQFTVVWATKGQSYSYFNDIRGQVFDRDGQRVGNEFLVNSQDIPGTGMTPSSNELHPAIAMNSAGGFAVTWTDNVSQQDGTKTDNDVSDAASSTTWEIRSREWSNGSTLATRSSRPTTATPIIFRPTASRPAPLRPAMHRYRWMPKVISSSSGRLSKTTT